MCVCDEWISEAEMITQCYVVHGTLSFMTEHLRQIIFSKDDLNYLSNPTCSSISHFLYQSGVVTPLTTEYGRIDTVGF